MTKIAIAMVVITYAATDQKVGSSIHVGEEENAATTRANTTNAPVITTIARAARKLRLRMMRTVSLTTAWVDSSAGLGLVPERQLEVHLSLPI